MGRLLGTFGWSGYAYNVLLIGIAYGVCVLVAMLSFRMIEQSSSRYLTLKWLRGKSE